VREQVLALCQNDLLPPWHSDWDQSSVLPSNAHTGAAYRGWNALSGMICAKRFGSNLFATSKQWFKVAKAIDYFDKFPGGKILLRKMDANGNVVTRTGKRGAVREETVDFAFWPVISKQGSRPLRDGEDSDG